MSFRYFFSAFFLLFSKKTTQTRSFSSNCSERWVLSCSEYRSRPIKSILAEARALVKTGVKELNVIAQDPMLYGVDRPPVRGARYGIVELLRALDGLEKEKLA